MDYLLTEFLAKTHRDEGQRKAGHVTRQAGQSLMKTLEGFPLAHMVTLGLWFLECDRKALCYIEPLGFCDLTSSLRIPLFLVCRGHLCSGATPETLNCCDSGNECFKTDFRHASLHMTVLGDMSVLINERAHGTGNHSDKTSRAGACQ